MSRLDRIRWAIALLLVLAGYAFIWFILDTYRLTIEYAPVTPCM